MPTRQQLFDKAIAGMIDQGRLSVDETFSCKYRLPHEGQILKCIFGQLLTDEQAEEIEGMSVESIPEEMLEDVLGEDYIYEIGFWQRIQENHDVAEDINDFLDRARTVALDCGLNWKFGEINENYTGNF